MNRFPPQHLEGYEHLIQDPYKLNDEVRGRREEFALLLERGIPLDCREPERCKYCYLQQLCDTLEGEITGGATAGTFEIVRVHTAWEAQQPPAFGGDPASKLRAASYVTNAPEGRRRLPLVTAPGAPVLDVQTPERLAETCGATTLHVVAPDLATAIHELRRFGTLRRLELRLDDYLGLEAALVEARRDAGPLAGRDLVRVEVRSPQQAQELLAIDGGFEVCVDLTKSTATWLESLTNHPARLSIRQPTYEKLSEAAEYDAVLGPLLARLPSHVPVEGVPACILGRAPRTRPLTLDTAMRDATGRLEISRFTRRYIVDRYMTKSLRCAECHESPRCAGMHVNFVRAHGYAAMQPLRDTASQTSSAATGIISSQP
jgi:hypothetical protein